MISRIREAIKRAGLPELPDEPRALLSDYGFDSLMTVLTVSQLEREFQVKIPASTIEDQSFESLASIQAFLEKLGVK